jgi:hypothetical protein
MGQAGVIIEKRIPGRDQSEIQSVVFTLQYSGMRTEYLPLGHRHVQFPQGRHALQRSLCQY